MEQKIDLNERVVNLEVEVAVLKNRIKILEQEGKSVTHNHYHPAPPPRYPFYQYDLRNQSVSNFNG